MAKEENKEQRRSFLLKAVSVVIAGIGFGKIAHNPSQVKEVKKIKMLTEDGKLVEIDESIYSQIAPAQQKASNKEVQEWMKTSKT